MKPILAAELLTVWKHFLFWRVFYVIPMIGVGAAFSIFFWIYALFCEASDTIISCAQASIRFWLRQVHLSLWLHFFSLQI